MIGSVFQGSDAEVAEATEASTNYYRLKGRSYGRVRGRARVRIQFYT